MTRKRVDHYEVWYNSPGRRLELIERERRVTERRIREARFPAVKSLDTFEFTAICKSQQDAGAGACVVREFITRRDNVIALANSGTGKTSKSGENAGCSRPAGHPGQ